MITSRDIITWMRWADAGPNWREREARAARVHTYVNSPGLGFVEKSMREFALAHAEHQLKDGDPDWTGWPEPSPPPDEKNAPLKEVSAPPVVVRERQVVPEWEGLISRDSPAYRRGGLHDGTFTHEEQLRAASKGSPFDASPEPMRKRRKREF